MRERSQILYAGLGLWASGLLIGANVIGFLPDEPSWPPLVLLAIGIVTTIGCSGLLFKRSQ